FWRSIFFEQPDLEKANAQAKRGEQSVVRAGFDASPSPLRPPHDYNVVIIAIESFNARVAAQTDMPFWKELAGRSYQLSRHYSTGNCTQYGVLGLLYGTPPVFYDGALGRGASP